MLEPDTIDVATPAVQLGVDRAGHFLQLEQPDVVGRHIVEFIGQAS